MKKGLVALFLVGSLVLTWYLFIKEGEFQVNFKVNTLPGDIIQTVKIWNRSLENGEIVRIDSLDGIVQEIEWNGNSYQYHWRLEMMSDTLTRVSISIHQPGRALLNKLLIPFTEQQIEVDANDLSHQVYKIIKEHLKITNVRIEGVKETKSNYCACTTLETNQNNKANGMMKDYGFLTSFISTYGLEVQGKPMVIVKEWNHNEDLLKFDFCFPIARQEYMPQNDLIHYKKNNSRKALKAIYNGNYITSDRAWYSLLHYAHKNGYEIDGLPIEVFYNNPNLGINEENWKAEIFLPIK